MEQTFSSVPFRSPSQPVLPFAARIEVQDERVFPKIMTEIQEPGVISDSNELADTWNECRSHHRC